MCATPGCSGNVHARGLCTSCYRRAKVAGMLPPARQRRIVPSLLAVQKRCPGCGVVKAGKDYYHHPTILYRLCASCHSERTRGWEQAHPEEHAVSRRNRALRKYGITVEQYDVLLQRQGGTCCICKCSHPGRRRFHVDHHPTLGHVRGLLCGACNAGLGLFQDSLALLRAASLYLEREGASGPS